MDGAKWERSPPTLMVRVRFPNLSSREFSLLLVLVLALRVFLRVLRFSSLHKDHFSKFQLDLKTVDKNRHNGMSITKFTYHKRQRLVAWVHYEEGGLQSGGLAERRHSLHPRACHILRACVTPHDRLLLIITSVWLIKRHEKMKDVCYSG